MKKAGVASAWLLLLMLTIHVSSERENKVKANAKAKKLFDQRVQKFQLIDTCSIYSAMGNDASFEECEICFNSVQLGNENPEQKDSISDGERSCLNQLPATLANCTQKKELKDVKVCLLKGMKRHAKLMNTVFDKNWRKILNMTERYQFQQLGAMKGILKYLENISITDHTKVMKPVKQCFSKQANTAQDQNESRTDPSANQNDRQQRETKARKLSKEEVEKIVRIRFNKGKALLNCAVTKIRDDQEANQIMKTLLETFQGNVPAELMRVIYKC